MLTQLDGAQLDYRGLLAGILDQQQATAGGESRDNGKGERGQDKSDRV